MLYWIYVMKSVCLNHVWPKGSLRLLVDIMKPLDAISIPVFPQVVTNAPNGTFFRNWNVDTAFQPSSRETDFTHEDEHYLPPVTLEIVRADVG